MHKSIYLQAAESLALDTDKYSCNAVRALSLEANRLYNSTMSPKYRNLQVEDIVKAAHESSPINHWGGMNCDECRNFRILLLCMMAAVCNDLD